MMIEMEPVKELEREDDSLMEGSETNGEDPVVKGEHGTGKVPGSRKRKSEGEQDEGDEVETGSLEDIERKYNIDPEYNRPALVYGPPEYFKKKRGR